MTLSPANPSAGPRLPRQADCAQLFGNPSHAGWADMHVVHVKPPYRLWMGEIEILSIKINKIAAPSLEEVLDDIWDACGQDASRIKAARADMFSGDWVIRQMRGLAATSMHAYALAVDFDAQDNPLGSAHAFFTESSPVVRSFEKHGWVWGGRWKTRPDHMHFQFAQP
jgi:hypothetical protein